MANNIEYSNEEIIFAKKKIKEKIHPIDFLDELNLMFKNNRTLVSLTNKLGRLGISYAGCESKKSKDARKELEVFSKDAQIMEMPKKEVNILVKREQEIQKLKTQLSISEKKYKTAHKEANLQESILKILKETVVALPTVKIPIIRSTKVEQTRETAALLLSDLHGGEQVSLSDTGGLNAYNMQIMSYRLKDLAESIIDISQNKLRGYSFPKLVVGGLGDFVSGIIHDELVESAENTVIEWTEGTALIVAQFLLDLAQVFPEIEFRGVIGNHGRLHQKVRYKQRYVNWDYITYEFLGLLLREQKNIKFSIPKSFWTLQTIEGKNFVFLHGDNIRSWAGIPWYGIQRMISKLRALLAQKEVKIDYVCLGHFHNAGTLDDFSGELILNGSVIGGSEYSMGKLFLSSNAKQIFMGVHPKRGVSWRYHLDIQDAPIPKKPYIYNSDQGIVEQSNILYE